MTRKIYRPMLAFALALGLLAAVANPGHAALSTAERAAATQAPASAELAAATTTPALAETAPVKTAAAPVTTAAAPVVQPAKVAAPKLKPRLLASAPRRGYPCH